MRIVFMGTPDFAKESLEAVYNAGYEILGVVTNPDKPKGRGMKMMASPVKEFAIEKNIKIYQPLKVKNNIEFIQEIKDLNPDIICVVAYGKILPKEILEIPKLGCINVHGSLLPRYRGAAPIQWAILNGDKTTGITTMYMDIGMDTGDMILKEEVDIGEDETTGELWKRLSK
ncbi:MAG: methionyl-tRNA formyltransferase, partial [Clostridia bacterium]|nr:methionyl-tRNA formyltransferase [Clostridia bacterium]